jgi:folate-binding protein YgfZ
MNTVVVDQSGHGQLRVTGKDRQRFLQGMLTNDVSKLLAGEFCRAAILNVKGRVLALVDVWCEPDGYLVLTEAVTSDKVRDLLAKHAIMDDVTFTPVTLAVHRVWNIREDVWTAPPVFAPAAGSPVEDVEIRRIEAGLPRYALDVTEDHFPFEANLERIISYTKGCYIGQEPVARAHSRGHANKRLVGIRLSGEGATVPGALVVSSARPDAGHVTSSVVSPDLGPIALAYVQKSSWDPGTAVEVAGRAGTVSALPF